MFVTQTWAFFCRVCSEIIGEGPFLRLQPLIEMLLECKLCNEVGKVSKKTYDEDEYNEYH